MRWICAIGTIFKCQEQPESFWAERDIGGVPDLRRPTMMVRGGRKVIATIVEGNACSSQSRVLLSARSQVVVLWPVIEVEESCLYLSQRRWRAQGICQDMQRNQVPLSSGRHP
jgi:hypothetical protein